MLTTRSSGLCWTLIGVIIAFVGVLSGHALSEEVLITSLVVNGTSPDAADPVPYPQVTFCPLWSDGTISNVQCYEVDNPYLDTTKGEHHTRVALQSQKIMKNKYPDKPNWACDAFNLDGKQMKDATKYMFCQVNSTNHGEIAGETRDWPGRVRVYLDTPGTTEFEHCETCIDGPDGTILVANQTAFVSWQAHQIEDSGVHNLITGKFQKVTDYRTSTLTLQVPEAFKDVIDSDMMVSLGFYSPDVWQYKNPGDLGSALAGERFGHFLAFVGGLTICLWYAHRFFGTLIVLVILGKEHVKASSTGYESQAIL